MRCARNLSILFFVYQNDSALYYNDISVRIAKEQADDALYVNLMCERAILYGMGGLATYGFGVLDSLLHNPAARDPSLRKVIYESYFDVYDYIYHLNLPGVLQTQSRIAIAAVRDSFYHYCPDNTEQALHTNAAVTSSKEIIEQLVKRFEHATTDMERATLSIIISNRYQSEAMPDEREIYLILSAIYHIRAARLDNEALIKVGKKMIDEEDWDRAEAYITLAHDQALFYGSRSREVQLSPLLKQIQEHISLKVRFWHTATIVVVIVLVLIVLIATLQWWLTKRRFRKFRQEIFVLEKGRTEAGVQAAADRVQAEAQADALTHFMGIATDATFEFVHLRNLVVRRLKNNDAASLLKQLSSQNGTAKAQRELLRKFDIAFIRLYPDFIAQVNALMTPENQISKPENELLSTELRLLALWRLGITDAGRVATILNLSVNTIYFYRNKLRAGAIDREHFNDGIMAIKGV